MPAGKAERERGKNERFKQSKERQVIVLYGRAMSMVDKVRTLSLSR